MKSGGKKLEEDFARWGKRNLNFEDFKLRELVNGDIVTRPYEVDIQVRIW